MSRMGGVIRWPGRVMGRSKFLSEMELWELSSAMRLGSGGLRSPSIHHIMPALVTLLAKVRLWPFIPIIEAGEFGAQ
jgi:hypothetical protein